MEDFINVSQQLGRKLLYVQGAGGNSSVKIGSRLYIKASGIKLKQLKNDYGYACIVYKPLKEFIISKNICRVKDEVDFLKLMSSQIIEEETFGKPSMETGFHAIIPSKYVFHLHSVYANVFNCMKYGSRKLNALCKDMNYTIIDYKNPGYELAYVLSKNKSLPPLIFLKNHGLIVHGENTKLCLNIIETLHARLETYLKDKKVYIPFVISDTLRPSRNYTFPDSAVFANIDIESLSNQKKKELMEITSAQHYMIDLIKRLQQKPKYLTKKEVYKLLNMDQEKHRLNVFNK